jgi:geranylgeranyl diphosphate synthase type I
VSLQETFDNLLPQVEAELKEIVRLPHHSLGAYYGMMRYHLGWTDEAFQPVETHPGKRIRPILCLLTCQALGGRIEQALPAAASLELIHNFSLVHDDIQDGSHTRRGRRAVWDIWGTAQGINVGDGLFVLARLALHRLGERGVSPARQQAATLALDRACLALCEGQYFDMTFEDLLKVDSDQYLWMIRHKTAALLATSAQLGAIIATDDTAAIAHLFSFGENLGMAFQVRDDILGAWGDEQLTGKSAATDIRDKKKTLPVVYALHQADDRDAARELARLYSQTGLLDGTDIQAALALLDRVGAREHAEGMEARYYQQAISSLDQLGLEAAAQANLRALARSLMGRQV